MTGAPDFDVLIVGAGFSGLYLLHRLRGLGLSARVLEAGDGVGGTWYWNRYPGARCDIESMQYSYSFSEALQQEWHWTERYAPQPEILAYANHVADRFDLRRDIQFGTRVTAASFGDHRWTLRTGSGAALTARFCVMATGCLSAGRLPEIPGIDDFKGASYHTGAWPHAGVDFTGRHVAVIGTGSSAIQSIPEIARQAASLTVFQRTPNYSVPARNQPMTPAYEADWKRNYAARREAARHTKNGNLYEFSDIAAVDATPEEREREYRARWQTGGINFMQAFKDLAINPESNATAADFVRARIREMVREPATAEALTPYDYPIGTKRICIDTNYFETFNLRHVRLVDIRRTPITAITAAGLRTTADSFEVDDIVYATGFDAMTGALARIAITGTGSETLSDKWRYGPRTYLGLMTAGFPNLFLITGPGSPSVLSNMMTSIEQHVDWVADCLAFLRGRGLIRIEPAAEAEADWVAHVNEVADRTLYPRAASWYMGANIAGKPRVFMPYIGGVGEYRRICDEIAAEGYRGFQMT
jgi:cyclohexanone monooxygenase